MEAPFDIALEFLDEIERRESHLLSWGLVDGRFTEDEILALSNPQGRDIPTIVLYLERMTETRRRDLAHLCLARRRTVIVVDETLIYSLCTERGLRLAVLFQCTFPFTTTRASPWRSSFNSAPGRTALLTDTLRLEKNSTSG